MPDAIVTDGLWRKSVSAVRSLGKSGYRVTVLGDSVLTTAFWSRYTGRRFLCPDAKNGPELFGERLQTILQQHSWREKPVLLAMEDDSLNWLSAHRDQVSPHADFLLPSAPSLAIAQSKPDTLVAAQQLGLPTLETLCPESVEAFQAQYESLSSGGLLENYIVKPVQGSGSAGIVYLDKDTAMDWRRHWQAHGKLMIQERIPAEGQGLGVSVLFDDAGRCVARFAHARLQQYPNTGGPSTSRISIVDDSLTQMSVQLLEALDWRGVAMVEWKMNPRTGSPVLMEINPRFWGSLELAVRAGVDFPTLYARAAQGATIDTGQAYRPGVVCRWLFPGDILRYLTQVRGQREGLREFLRGLPGTAEEWDGSDLRGFLASFFCPLFTALNPRYWKYLRR